MALEQDVIARLYLFVVVALLAIATGYVYIEFGLGLGVYVLGALTVVAFSGLVSASQRIRKIVVAIFSSSL